MNDRPGYLRLADDLRAGILAGQYPPGSQLPTGAELRRRYGVSTTVVQMAIRVLRGEGLVDTATRAGTTVREQPPVRRVAGERYKREARNTGQRETSFTRDQRIGWHQYRLDKQFTEIEAGDRLAALFGWDDPTVMLLRRRFVFHARGVPTQMSWTYLPLDLVTGTPLANPDREPWPGGTPAQMAYLGLPLTRVEETVAARMPTPEETDALVLGDGIPVFAITRQMCHHGRVIEVADPIVIPTDRAVLDYTINVNGD